MIVSLDFFLLSHFSGARPVPPALPSEVLLQQLEAVELLLLLAA